MWLVGILPLMILVGLFAGFLPGKRGSTEFATDFDLMSLSEEYSAITGPLAGFSIAAAIFLANLSRIAEPAFFADVMALFLIAFIMLMATAIIPASFRAARMDSLPEHHHEVHCVLFIVSNLIFYLSLSVSWLGLRPRLLSIDLSSLADVFTWLLLFALLAGATGLGAWLHTLLGVKLLPSVLVPVVPMAAAIVYGLTLAQRFPALWPPVNPVLSLAILVFAIAAVGGGVKTSMITFYGQRRFHHRLRRLGNMLAHRSLHQWCDHGHRAPLVLDRFRVSWAVRSASPSRPQVAFLMAEFAA